MGRDESVQETCGSGSRGTYSVQLWAKIRITITTTDRLCVNFLPIVGTLIDLSPVVWLLLNWFKSLGVWGLLIDLDHVRGAGLWCRREATQCGQCRGTVRIKAFGLQLSLSQEHLPSLHLLLQLIIIRLEGKWKRRDQTISLERQQSNGCWDNDALLITGFIKCQLMRW